MKETKKIIYLALLVSIALALSLIESLIPLPIIIPGVKLGLSNMVTLTAVIIFGFKESLTITILKSFLTMLLSGNVVAMIYSLSAGIGSCIVMNLTYREFSKKRSVFSIIGVSIIGSATHNLIQVTVASFVLATFKIYIYLPVLLIISLFTGYFIGLGCIFISENLKINLKKIS